MGNKYYDSKAALQVIGCSIIQPSLLDDDGVYFYTAQDFEIDLHKVAFGAIYNLHQMGAEKVNLKTIEDYLQSRPESYGVYNAGKGGEWLQTAIDNADLPNFNYYYDSLKKMTLLRGYAKAGVDISWIYDPDNNLDIQAKEKQRQYLDSLSIEELANLVDEKILTVRDTYVDNATNEAQRIGDGLESLLFELEETPDIGAPLFDATFNSVTRGARLGKYFLRSAPTGVGNQFCRL